ncbi:MAG: hypothetical protein KIS92_13270 [Planctomycetota bacterium]|nr:hypothetical protein [Planctomycetota bacterium]
MQPLALVVALVVLVLGTVVPFFTRQHLMPEMITSHGGTIDNQIYITMFITGAIFALAQFALAYMVFRYQAKGQKATYVHGIWWVEVGSIVSSGILFIGLNLMGQGVWANMHLKEPSRQATEIEVNGQQFKWYFRYAGNDGIFGDRSAKLVDDASQNFMGVDYENDKYAKDDVVEAAIKVPFDRDVVVRLRSRDVIHDFFVRELRVKNDAVPGLEVKIPFRVDKERMYKFDLSGVTAATLDAKDVSAVKGAFESHGIKVTDNAEITPIEFKGAGGKVIKRWEFKTYAYSLYDPVNKFWPLTYSIFDEGGVMKVYKTGYEVVCAELCGNGHYTMRAEMEVVSGEEFDAWLAKRSEECKSYH